MLKEQKTRSAKWLKSKTLYRLKSKGLLTLMSILITGATGFVGAFLVEKFIRQDKEVTLLIEKGFTKKVEDKKHIVGDITKSHFNLHKNEFNDLKGKIKEVYHLAAAYKLDIDKKTAYEVNVDGTRNVLEFCKEAKNLEYLAYISTCMVSGKRCGVILESDFLNCGFNNCYEESKFEAEALVREYIKEYRLPALIFRPGPIVGDSKTGATEKFDGLYYVIEALSKTLFGRTMLLPLGNGKNYFQSVPVDFVVNAIYEISKSFKEMNREDFSKEYGNTFQLTDPNPLKVKELIKEICKNLNVKEPLFCLPKWIAPIATTGLKLWNPFSIPKETLPYFTADVFYDSKQTQKVLDSRIICPRAKDYLPEIINYWKSKKS